MPTFPDLREFFDPALVLPIGGHTYRFEAPTFQQGVRLRRLMRDLTYTEGKSDFDYVREIMRGLGAEYDEATEAFSGTDDSVFEQLVAAGESWPTILRVAETVAANWAFNEAYAMSLWASALTLSLDETDDSASREAEAKD